MDDQQFYVMGNISKIENIKDNAEVTLNIDQNENIKEIPCIIKYETQLKYYELECTPKQAISFHLDNVDGKILNKALIISMADGANDFINIPFLNNDYGKKSSDKGLSTGAIIGIVIACVAIAIISTLITMLLCRKSVKPPLQNNTTQIDIYSNVSKSSQQNISK